MAEKESRISPDLFRQRRNLLVANIILWSINFTGLKTDQINFFGITATLEKDFNIFYLVFFFWVYFFIRFVQYLYDERSTVSYEYCKIFQKTTEKLFKKGTNINSVMPTPLVTHFKDHFGFKKIKVEIGGKSTSDNTAKFKKFTKKGDDFDISCFLITGSH